MYSWIYQFFSFFPVIVCLVIIIRVLHTSCDKFHKHEQHSRSTCTTTHSYISIAGKRRKCRDPRRHCWWHAMENNKQYYYTTIHRRDGTHGTLLRNYMVIWYARNRTVATGGCSHPILIIVHTYTWIKISYTCRQAIIKNNLNILLFIYHHLIVVVLLIPIHMLFCTRDYR